jgi:internalin A
MINFKLCYQIPGANGLYIAPQLLTAAAPQYNWDSSNNLVIRYIYEFLPKGMLTRLIVAMHQLIADNNCVWKSGAVFMRNGARAEATELFDRKEI